MTVTLVWLYLKEYCFRSPSSKLVVVIEPSLRSNVEISLLQTVQFVNSCNINEGIKELKADINEKVDK